MATSPDHPHPIPEASGWRRIALVETGSTNDIARQAALQGDPGQLWVTAGRQLAGRGRRGRNWVSEPGNLYASALVVTTARPEAMGVLPLVAGLALHEAIARLVPVLAPGLSLKWPNDLLLNGAKLSGILLEGQPLDNGRHAVIVGFGVNLAHGPDEAAYPVATLATHGPAPAPDSAFAALAASFQAELARWDEGRGTGAVVARWRHAAAGIGKPIRVNLPDRTLDGRFADVDERGYLLLDQPGGTIRIAAGDVFLMNQS